MGLEEEVLRCPCTAIHRFGGRYPQRALDVEVEGGVRYPDVLGCGSWPLLVVSQAVLDDWTRGGVTGFRAYPLRIASARGKRIQDAEPPVYHHIEVTGRCELDLDAMGLRIAKICLLCGYRTIKPVWPVPWVIKRGTWDGSDLFASDLWPRAAMCTDKVVRLAGENRRTNFGFIPIERCREPGVRSVDYVKEAKRMAREEAGR